MVNSNDNDTLYQGVFGFGKIRGMENPPNIIIDSGVVSKLMKFTGKESYKNLWFECTHAFANMSAGTSSQMDKGIISVLFNLLDSSVDNEAKGNAILALGNIAGD